MSNTYLPLQNAIGIFDSGVGGLSVLKEIRKQMPGHPLLYFGDQFHVPYGSRELDEVYELSKVITQFLIKSGARIIVVACNTASAAALYPLRKEFPNIPFIGMEPAVKPAAETTHTGRVGVLATPATFQGELYSSVVERFAKNVKIFQDTCSGLVQEIEKGHFDGFETQKILRNALLPMMENKIDSVVLGCTHYPFVIPMIKEIVGPEISVIDPAPAIARQTQRILAALSLDIPQGDENKIILFTSGSKELFKKFVEKINLEQYKIKKVNWDEDRQKINIIQTKLDQN